MEQLKYFLKQSSVQYFLIFILFIISFAVTISPLIDASPSIDPAAQENSPDSLTASEEKTLASAKLSPEVTKVVVVTGEVPAKIYADTNTQKFPIAELKKEQYALLLNQINDEWLQIQFNQQVAWVEAKSVLQTHLLTGFSGKTLSVYQDAKSTSKVIGTIPYGVLFYLLDDQTESFQKVRYGNLEGFVDSNQTNYAVDNMNDLYKEQASLPLTLDAHKMMVVKLNNTPVYSSPDAMSEPLKTIRSGLIFNYEDREQAFYKISLDNKTTGYIPAWLVTTNFATIESDAALPQGIEQAKIVIDPGHGGEDPGAVVDFSSQHEADYTLETALLLKTELENMGATVVLTRSNDTSVSLADRALLSNQEQANAFISLHFDSGPTAAVSGTTSYFFGKNSENLAQTIDKYIAGRLPLKNQGTKFQNFMVLRDNAQPSILLELGYLNNPEDHQLIASKDYRETVAKSIASGLKEYFQ